MKLAENSSNFPKNLFKVMETAGRIAEEYDHNGDNRKAPRVRDDSGGSEKWRLMVTSDNEQQVKGKIQMHSLSAVLTMRMRAW